MTVIINEFEVIPQPQTDTQPTVATPNPQPVQSTVQQTLRIMKREKERRLRIRAY